jgi:hypothetical protein
MDILGWYGILLRRYIGVHASGAFVFLGNGGLMNREGDPK